MVRRITQTFHDDIANELEQKQQELNDRLKMLTSDNKSFQVTASYLLDLAQRAAQLFQESDETLQQKLLEYVLANIELNDKKLSYVLTDPFKTIVEAKKKAPSGSNPNIWCYSVRSISNAIQTAAQQLHDDYTLKDLVEEFQLNGELLASAV